MKTLDKLLTRIAFFGVMSAILGCQFLTPTETEEPPTLVAGATSSPTAAVTEQPTSPATEANTTEPATQSPSPTTAPTIAPTATTGPECIVLQSLNLRSGPGIAYRPPVRALATDTRLIPLGYNPTGVPGGSWVQVQEPLENLIGWVSGGGQFISCNIDLTTLPEISVPPPPPPAPPSADASAPDGSFPDGWVWDDIFDPNFFVRMMVYDQFNGGVQDGDGILNVRFQVTNPDGDSVWERTEATAAYCIFAGGEPNCNPWVLEDYFYVWGEGGPQVVEGEHQLSIIVESTAGETGNWNYTIMIDLPY